VIRKSNFVYSSKSYASETERAIREAGSAIEAAVDRLLAAGVIYVEVKAGEYMDGTDELSNKGATT
jgi:hypothetical protein